MVICLFVNRQKIIASFLKSISDESIFSVISFFELITMFSNLKFTGFVMEIYLSIFALIVSIAAFVFSIIRYKSAFPTIKVVRNKSKNFKGNYSIKITCGNVSNQFLVLSYRMLKRKYPFYYKEIVYRFHSIEPNFLVTSEKEIRFNPTYSLDNGKYKLILLNDRTPKKLKLKFNIPHEKTPKLTK